MRRGFNLRHSFPGLQVQALVLCTLLWSVAQPALAQEHSEEGIPDRYSLGLTVGHTFDPVDNIGFLLLTGSALYDYDKVWRHPAPGPLRFKVEANVGGSFEPERDLMASAGILALYFLDSISGSGFKPYMEGGIGLICTQHRVENQGLHFNLNPQVGVGTELTFVSGATYFTALRWHHISNGGLNHENRGINSIVLVIGKFLW